jgi:cytochrome P450
LQMTTLTTYDEARDAFRSRHLRQALYDDGHRLMSGVIVNLHGDEHIARRRLENRLFRRDTFTWYERERIPQIVADVLRHPIERGRGELADIARRTMMNLSIDVAGVDLPVTGSDGDASFDRLYELMHALARASTVAHATGNTDEIRDIVAQGDGALMSFATEFFQASLARRADLVESFERGEIDDTDLPRDVLTTLLRNHDRLELSDEVVLREIAYYPWVGSHSTAAQLVHAMHHIFEWVAERPEDRPRLIADDELRQRFVHESMRLHPASPVALRHATTDVVLRSGRVLTSGDTVVISVADANRDPAVFGTDPERFDPARELVDGTPPWGLSFGHGTHACLGQELAGGVEPHDALGHHLIGSVALMAGRLLRAGARPDPDDAATLDDRTTRHVWGRYPVLLSE